MRWIMTIPALLAVALLSVTTPVLAAEALELRVLEGPFTFEPAGFGAIAPQPAIDAPTFYQLDDRGVR